MMFHKRISCYCKEQLEPGSRLLLSVIVTVFIYLLIRLDHQIIDINWYFLIPAFSTFLLLLYYRISDEFKDQKTDATFFPDRPIPSGRLFISDLRIMLIVVSAIACGLNMYFPAAQFEFAVAFTFTVAMGKWFFMEKIIANNRLIAFFTHAPVGILLYWYAETYLLNISGVTWSLPEKLSVIGFILHPGLTWEVLRKTYLPQDEMPGYQIYSTMLGFKGSLLFASVWVLLTLINNFLLVSLFEALDGLTLPLVVLNMLLLIVIVLHGYRPRLKNLKPIAEIYMGIHLLLPLTILIIRTYV